MIKLEEGNFEIVLKLHLNEKQHFYLDYIPQVKKIVQFSKVALISVLQKMSKYLVFTSERRDAVLGRI